MSLQHAELDPGVPWELRHFEWRTQGNRCTTCEREARGDRGLHSPYSDWTRWDLLVLACAGWWYGTLVPVLRSWARLAERGLRLRFDGAGAEARTADTGPPSELRRLAESADLVLAGLCARGPATSRPDWEAEVTLRDLESRAAWTAWADALLGSPYTITNHDM